MTMVEELRERELELKKREEEWPLCNACLDESGCDVKHCELRVVIKGKARCRT